MCSNMKKHIHTILILNYYNSKVGFMFMLSIQQLML